MIGISKCIWIMDRNDAAAAADFNQLNDLLLLIAKIKFVLCSTFSNNLNLINSCLVCLSSEKKKNVYLMHHMKQSNFLTADNRGGIADRGVMNTSVLKNAPTTAPC